MIDLRHRRIRRQVEAYVDGYVTSPAQVAAVRAHLAECWNCSGDADTLRLIKVSLRRLGSSQPADLREARIRHWAETVLQ